MQNRQVVITGFKILSSVGWSLEDNTDVLYGKQALKVSAITRYNTDGVSLKYGAEIPSKIDNIWDRKLRKYASLKDVGALSTIKQVWEETKACGVYDSKRSSLYTGMGSNQAGDLTGYFANVIHCLDENYKFDSSKFGATLLDSLNPMIVMEAILNNTLCYGSKYLEFRGRNANLMDWEAASFWAIKEGIWAIKEGRSDVAVVGGTCASLDPFNVMEDSHLGYYNKQEGLEGEDKEEVVEGLADRIHPYSRVTTGSIPVEGSCYLVLEEETAAQKRGAKILGRILGVVSLCGGRQSLGKAVEEVMKQSSTRVEDICFISGSGCGTPLDLKELEALRSVIKKKTLMFSPRGSFYNMIEPSTALGVASSIIAYNNKMLPPTLNYSRENSVCEENLCISSKAQPLDLNKSKVLIPCISRNEVVGALVIDLA